MKLLHLCLAAGVLIPLATSCSQDAPWSAGGGETGKISLKLKTDHSVATATRANDAESPVKPDGESFAIRLENSDGSYVKEWENLSKFNDEEGFPRGNYTVTASYGSIEEQGFTKPYYVGTEQVSVVPGESSDHSITAVLANSMVSIRYTDSFQSQFSSYSASLTSKGIVDPVSFSRNETRPAYVKPGEVTVNFNIKSPEGQEITVSPAKFTALPRRHYIITANVKGSENNGAGVLEVIFEENVQYETEEILLSDDLFKSSAPEITVQNFEVDSTIETFESVNLDSKPEFHVVAFGGIKEAKFTVELVGPDGTLPAFNGEVDLANADAATQNLVKQSGLKCFGFFKQVGDPEEGNKMAVIEMKEFIENLDPGEYKISLSVKDKLGRVNPAVTRTRADGEVVENPVSFYAKINRINFELKKDVAPRFMADRLSVIVETNYEGALDEFSFETEDRNGNMQKSKILSSEKIASETGDTFCRRFVLSTDNIDDTNWMVTASYPKKDNRSIELWATVPDYQVEIDAFAKKIMLKMVPSNSEDLVWMTEKAKFYFVDNNGEKVISDGLTRDPKTGMITIENTDNEKTRFIPGTDYSNFYVTFGNNTSYHSTKVTFKTEEATDVPNGNFSKEGKKLKISDLQVGGEYKVSPVDYAHKSSIDRTLPDEWSTINDLTCWTGSSNKNTWFMVPSTYLENSKVKIVSVGYNHNGTTPKTSGGAFNIKYYCENAPSENDLHKAAGELFLGSYSYDGSEHRTDGIPFSSRPEKLSFDYSYKPLNGDKGLAEIKILDAAKNIIIEKKLELEAAENKHVDISITGYTFMSKPASLQLLFKSSNSSTPPIKIPSRSELNEGQGLGNKKIDANSYHALATGSELELDNVMLIY